jgi:O-antigen/teichoic acid export membrane protein
LSAISLVIRQIIIQSANLTTSILMARWLDPATYGIYGTMTFLLSFMIVFSDVGLGASLVRQVSIPTIEEYRSIFSFQQIASVVVFLLLFFSAPYIVNYLSISYEYVWLFRAIGLSIYVSSFQSICSIGLERSLNFKALALVETSQTIIYNLTLIIGVLLKTEPLTFAIAILLRSVCGAIIINVMYPWRPIWFIEWKTIRKHLKFGLPYQGVSFVSLIKDSITPVLVGGLLGIQAVGYINWAQTLAAYPVMALMVLQRIYMPLFSRLQNQKDRLERYLEMVLFMTNSVTAILACITLALAPYITELIFGNKWVVALPIFYLVWGGNLFIATSTPLIALLNALGRANISFRFALIWLASTWLFGVPLILKFGFVGYGLASILVQLTNVILFVLVKKEVYFSVKKTMFHPWIIALTVALMTHISLLHYPVRNIISLGLTALFMAGFYFCILFFTSKLSKKMIGNLFLRENRV